jgi:hypothetical protein
LVRARLCLHSGTHLLGFTFRSYFPVWASLHMFLFF